MLKAKDQEHKRKYSQKKKKRKKGIQKKTFQKERSSKVSFRGELSPKNKVFQTTFFRRSLIEANKKGLRKFSARFLAFSNKILTVQKIVLCSVSSKNEATTRKVA